MKNHVGRLFLYCLLAYRAVDARATRGSNSRRRIGVFEENDFFVPAKTAKVKNNDTAPKNATKAPSKVVTKAPTTLKGQESKQLPKTVEPTTTFSPSKGRIKKKTKAEGSKSGTMAGKSLKKVNKGMGGKKTGKNAGGESFSPTSLTTQPPTAPTTGPPFHTPTEPPGMSLADHQEIWYSQNQKADPFQSFRTKFGEPFSVLTHVQHCTNNDSSGNRG